MNKPQSPNSMYKHTAKRTSLSLIVQVVWGLGRSGRSEADAAQHYAKLPSLTITAGTSSPNLPYPKAPQRLDNPFGSLSLETVQPHMRWHADWAV
jgi:hypothetical protein